MKSAIIIPCEVAKAPYVQYYIDLFKEQKVEYDIISWNKTFNENNPLAYDLKSKDGSKIRKLFDLIKFINYAIKTIKKGRYDMLIVHTVVLIILMSFFLSKYKGKIILDIRDYSKILNFKMLNSVFKMMIRKADMVCISSSGFKEWLPRRSDYVLSHNITKDLLFSDECLESYSPGSTIVISTMGQITYYEQNIHLINDLRDNKNFEVRYYGYGPDEAQLRNYVSDQKIINVYFYGKYDKKDEKSLYHGASFISCYCNDSKTKRTVMSNRFYLSLLCGIPFIATKDSLQAKIIEQANLGFGLCETDNVVDKVDEFYRNFEYDKFLISRQRLINVIRDEYITFESSLIKIIENNV